jgi:starch phosphorylase
VENLLNHDHFLVLADYQAYLDSHEAVSRLWKDQKAWTRASILNTARMGKFSSDRSISEYAANIWKVTPLRLALPEVMGRASKSQKPVTAPGSKVIMPPTPPSPPPSQIRI